MGLGARVDKQTAAAVTLQREVRRWLEATATASTRGGVALFSDKQRLGSARDAPSWLGVAWADTKPAFGGSGLAAALEGYAAEFAAEHAAQAQHREVLFELLGAMFMGRQLPDVARDPGALLAPFMDPSQADALRAELRAALRAHVLARAGRDKLGASEHWAFAGAEASRVASERYEAAVATAKRNLETSPDLAARVELDVVAASIDGVIQRDPAQGEAVFAMLHGRRLTPRLRAMVWRNLLAEAHVLRATERSLERQHADLGAEASVGTLLRRVVTQALGSELKLYDSPAAREHILSVMSTLYLISPRYDDEAVRACVAVSLGLPGESAATSAVLAHAVIEKCAAAAPNLAVADGYVLMEVRESDPALHKHLTDPRWQSVVESVLKEWASSALIGPLTAGCVLVVLDACVLGHDWVTPVQDALCASLLAMRMGLLDTSTAAEVAEGLRRGAAGVAAEELRLSMALFKNARDEDEEDAAVYIQAHFRGMMFRKQKASQVN